VGLLDEDEVILAVPATGPGLVGPGQADAEIELGMIEEEVGGVSRSCVPSNQ
jgi:hypothetical protein